MQFSKKDLFTVPNILTYIRLICVPIFIGVMIAYCIDKTATQYLWAAFGLFVFASATDIADGYIAPSPYGPVDACARCDYAAVCGYEGAKREPAGAALKKDGEEQAK